MGDGGSKVKIRGEASSRLPCLYVCVCAMPKRFGRGKERLAGFALYFYAMCLCFLEEKEICAISACVKYNVAKHPAFPQEGDSVDYGCIQPSPQLISIVRLNVS